MNNFQTYNKGLEELSLSDIERFLYVYGWKELNQENEKVKIFLYPKVDTDSHLRLVLPSNKEYIDYYDRILDTLNILSKVHRKNISQVIKEITLTSHDVFKARLYHKGTYSNSIPLSVASEDIKSLKDLFVYSACSEESSLPYYEKPLLVGINHVNLCQFGHTFDGSFGFTINSPITSDTENIGHEQYSLINEPIQSTFERRVMERIIRGLNLVEDAVNKDDGDIVVNNYDSALNARMCKAFIDISESMNTEVDYYISWSSQVVLSEDVQHNNNWHLSKPHYRMLEYAESELNKVSPRVDTIIGQVVTLHSNKNPLTEGDFIRQAIIKYEYDGKKVDVKMDLDIKGYDIVYTAHGKGQPVKVTGTLYRKGNIWRMVDIENITMLII